MSGPYGATCSQTSRVVAHERDPGKQRPLEDPDLAPLFEARPALREIVTPPT